MGCSKWLFMEETKCLLFTHGTTVLIKQAHMAKVEKVTKNPAELQLRRQISCSFRNLIINPEALNSVHG